MKAYTKILATLIRNQLENSNSFCLIKLENFPIPEIYVLVCKEIKKFAKINGIDLVAKLSKEKYEFWKSDLNNFDALTWLEDEQFIEMTDNLTKWRNDAFNSPSIKRTAVILMGTELVLDQGGIEDFYTINPERIEVVVKDNYSELFDLQNNDNGVLNNVFKNIFRYIEKDLLKMSIFAQNYDGITKESELVELILRSCYETWGLPNLTTLFERYTKLNSGMIKEIRKAYNFNRRIGLDNLPTKKKLDEMSDKISKYYDLNQEDLDNDFSKLFTGYTHIDEVKEDILDYYRGVNIDDIRNKLCNCDFITIDKMLGLKIGAVESTKNRDIKIYGDPINVFLVSALKTYAELSCDERRILKKVSIQIDQIKIANIAMEDNEELSLKWKKMCRFLGGIELAFNELNIVNDSDEPVTCTIHSLDSESNEIYPFTAISLNGLISNQVLCKSSARDTVSKILFEITFINENEELVKKERYEWCIYDGDNWIQMFDIIDTPELSNNGALNTISSYIPVGIGRNIGKLLDSLNIDEFVEMYSNSEIEYMNMFKQNGNPDPIDVKSNFLGNAFVKLLRGVNEKGFFKILKDQDQKEIFINYLKAFNELTQTMSNCISNITLQEKIYSLTKAFTIISNKNELEAKGASITIIPSYHPIMLEKIIERYSYLSNGLAEIVLAISAVEKVKKNQIDKYFERLDQLSTITFATGATLNSENKFEDEKKTFGYATILGKSNSKVDIINLNADYAKEIDVLDSLSGKLIPTPVSKYIAKTILNYFKIYPFKTDGIKVLFFNPQDYSDIIIAIKTTLDVLKKEESLRLKMDLIIYTDDFRCRAYNYLKHWIDNNITEEDTISLNARIKYIDLEKNNYKKNMEEEIVNVDIAFVGNIMEVIDIAPEIVREKKTYGIEISRYPSTFLPIPKGETTKRFLAISQLQFECENYFTQLLAKINTPNITAGSYRLVKESKMKKEISGVIDTLHKKSSWVVILDETVDPRLIRHSENEIIGFSTGEGYFGELNATISSDASILKDIEKHLIKRLKKRFDNWSQDEIKNAALNCVKYARNLDGAEVLKAINPRDEAVNNYLGFYLTSLIEQRNVNLNDYYYRKLLSLDSYDHLFDTSIDEPGYHQTKPDFILIEIPRVNNALENHDLIQIDIKIIECKMGSNIYTRIDDAMVQVFEGYNQLNDIWNETKGIRKRYWNNQLYKILSLQNSVELDPNELDEYTNRILQTISSDYVVHFKRSIYTFSIDEEKDYSKELSHEGIVMTQYNFGMSSVKSLLVDNEYDSEFIQSSVSNIKSHILETFNDSQIISTLTNEANLNILQFEESILDSTTINSQKDVQELLPKNDIFEQSHSKRLLYQDRYLNIFKSYGISNTDEEYDVINKKLQKLIHELALRKVKIYIKDFIFGPDIVRISLTMATGVNIDQFTKYAEDMKLWLGINEKPYIYIRDGHVMMDIVRINRQTIGLKDAFTMLRNTGLLSNIEEKFYALLGSDILGTPKLIDFSDSNTPHLLIAGQTGSGKSVLLNSMLISIMMIYKPDEVEMILVDPKFIELTAFKNSPYTKIVATEAEPAMDLLEGLVVEMNQRYKLFMNTNSKQLASYNAKVGKESRLKRILMVFDEYAALMEENKEISKRLESAIKVLSQKARAAGIHMIICTQSPKADILTTTIRNNLTARVGLRVADSVASGLILDSAGAESLLGKGDMLLKTAESSELLRAKSPFVTEEEIEKFIEQIEGEQW